MATKKATAKAASARKRGASSEAVPRPPTGEDAPISNGHDTETQRVARREVEPGSGQGAAKAVKATDGTEGVSGYKRRRETEMGELSVPGDLDDLPDIGDAPHSARRPRSPRPSTGPTTACRSPTPPCTRGARTPRCSSRPGQLAWIGTGWFIGPHTLMTAGHVVYIKNSGVPGRDGWVSSITVMPGRNGTTLPYGSVTSRTSAPSTAGPTAATSTTTTAPSSCRPTSGSPPVGSASASTTTPP